MEFNEYTLKDISLNITDGVHNTVIDDPAGDCFLLSCKNIKDYHIIISAKERTISHDTLLRLRNRTKTEKDDILITSVGTIGELSLVKDENPNYEFQRSVAIIKPNKLIVIPEYLMYSLKYEMPQINKFVKGAVQKCLFINDLKQIVVKLPSLANQKKIVQLLMSIDRKIELNNQINNNLHELCKNLYRNYFIDNTDIKWQADKLGDYLTVDRGLSYKGKFLSDIGTSMINLGNIMPNGVFRIEKSKYYTGEYKDNVTTKVGDIVIANTDMTQNREVIGTPVIIPPLYASDIIFSHHIYCLRNLKLPKMFLFYTFLTDEWNGVAGGNATGTTVLALPKETIENYKIRIPDELTLNKFENIATKIQDKRDNILLENINLEKLRDTLLPKLMNGEIDLENIEI